MVNKIIYHLCSLFMLTTLTPDYPSVQSPMSFMVAAKGRLSSFKTKLIFDDLATTARGPIYIEEYYSLPPEPSVRGVYLPYKSRVILKDKLTGVTRDIYSYGTSYIVNKRYPSGVNGGKKSANDKCEHLQESPLSHGLAYLAYFREPNHEFTHQHDAMNYHHPVFGPSAIIDHYKDDIFTWDRVPGKSESSQVERRIHRGKNVSVYKFSTNGKLEADIEIFVKDEWSPAVEASYVQFLHQIIQIRILGRHHYDDTHRLMNESTEIDHIFEYYLFHRLVDESHLHMEYDYNVFRLPMGKECGIQLRDYFSKKQSRVSAYYTIQQQFIYNDHYEEDPRETLSHEENLELFGETSTHDVDHSVVSRPKKNTKSIFLVYDNSARIMRKDIVGQSKNIYDLASRTIYHMPSADLSIGDKSVRASYKQELNFKECSIISYGEESNWINNIQQDISASEFMGLYNSFLYLGQDLVRGTMCHVIEAEITSGLNIFSVFYDINYKMSEYQQLFLVAYYSKESSDLSFEAHNFKSSDLRRIKLLGKTNRKGLLKVIAQIDFFSFSWSLDTLGIDQDKYLSPFSIRPCFGHEVDRLDGELILANIKTSELNIISKYDDNNDDSGNLLNTFQYEFSSLLACSPIQMDNLKLVKGINENGEDIIYARFLVYAEPMETTLFQRSRPVSASDIANLTGVIDLSDVDSADECIFHATKCKNIATLYYHSENSNCILSERNIENTHAVVVGMRHENNNWLTYTKISRKKDRSSWPSLDSIKKQCINCTRVPNGSDGHFVGKQFGPFIWSDEKDGRPLSIEGSYQSITLQNFKDLNFSAALMIGYKFNRSNHELNIVQAHYMTSGIAQMSRPSSLLWCQNECYKFDDCISYEWCQYETLSGYHPYRCSLGRTSNKKDTAIMKFDDENLATSLSRIVVNDIKCSIYTTRKETTFSNNHRNKKANTEPDGMTKSNRKPIALTILLYVVGVIFAFGLGYNIKLAKFVNVFSAIILIFRGSFLLSRSEHPGSLSCENEVIIFSEVKSPSIEDSTNQTDVHSQSTF